MAKQEPKRPKDVPQNAIWNSQNGEWETGAKNSDGKMIGEWKWWLAPNGHLCCHSFFDDNGQMVSFKRFHPNGEVSQYGEVGDNGKFKERVYVRTEGETTEIFPVQSATVWTAKVRPGVPVSYDLFDKDGNQINGFELSDDVFKGYENQEPIEGFKRICNVIDDVLKNVSNEYSFLGPEYKPVFTQKIHKEDIEICEKRLGLKLPPSYVDFVLNHGLFKGGENKTDEFRMLHPVKFGRLSDALAKDWYVDWDNFTSQEQEIMDKIIYFSMGDDGLQITWFYCFDFNTLNPDTGEVELIEFNQDDWTWMCNSSDIKKYEGITMRAFIAKLAQRVLERVKDELE